MQAITNGAIAYLVVILYVASEAMRAEMVRGPAMDALAKVSIDAVVDEVLFKRFSKLGQFSKVRVVAARRFALQGREKSVMKVVAPLRVHAKAASLAWKDEARIVEVALRDQDELTAQGCAERFGFSGKLLKEVNGGAVNEGMYCIQAQSVDVIIAHPHQRVVDEEAPYLARTFIFKIDSAAPGCLVRVVKIGAKLSGVVSDRPKVVVDHIEQNRQAFAVRGVHEALEGVGAAIRLMDRE